jgi:4-alpha-glucanotransferase
MVVLLWAFEGPDDNPHLFMNHREHQVMYTSTHDTDTLAGFFPDRDPWELLELALSSRPALTMVPAQDVLGLGSEARMNMPGTTGASWRWRMEPDALTDELAARLRASTQEAGR